jgi:hypothetical protein
MAEIAAALLPAHAQMLARWSRKPVRNVLGRDVGTIRPSAEFVAACQSLAVAA